MELPLNWGRYFINLWWCSSFLFFWVESSWFTIPNFRNFVTLCFPFSSFSFGNYVECINISWTLAALEKIIVLLFYFIVEDTLWTGTPGNYTNPNAPDALLEVRKLVDNDKFVEATAAAVKLSGNPSDVCYFLTSNMTVLLD